MTTAHWFTDYDGGGIPVELAALGGCMLAVAYVGGEWQWLVSCDARYLAEGAARGCVAAKQQAEAAARSFLDVVPRAA